MMLVGLSVAFNILGKMIYLAYGSSAGKAVTAKKSSDSMALFSATLTKTILLALTYAYIGIGVYFTVDNAGYIPDTSKLATTYIVALALDLIVIDSVTAFLTSMCGR